MVENRCERSPVMAPPACLPPFCVTLLQKSEAESCLQLNGPAAECLPGNSKVTVNRLNRPIWIHRSQCVIDLRSINVQLVEKVVRVDSHFDLRIFAKDAHIW